MSKHPKTSRLIVGNIFERLPSELCHHKLKGTHPLYGRLINEVRRVSKHKLELMLGYNLEGVIRHDVITSDETLIVVYGEIDLYITNAKDFKCQTK